MSVVSEANGANGWAAGADGWATRNSAASRRSSAGRCPSSSSSRSSRRTRTAGASRRRPGARPSTMPRLKSACQKMSAPTPTASTAPKRSLRRRRDADRPEHEEAVERRRARSTRRSPSPPRRPANGKSRVLVRQEVELVLRALHEALARPAAVADRDARVVRVPAAAEDVRLGVQEHEDALLLVVLHRVRPRERQADAGADGDAHDRLQVNSDNSSFRTGSRAVQRAANDMIR